MGLKCCLLACYEKVRCTAYKWRTKKRNDVQKTVLVVVANPFYYVEKLILSTKNDTIKKGSF
jgi:hypothetical protein